MQVSARQIAALIDGIITGDPEVTISGPSKIEEGQPGTITFLANPKYKEYIYTTQASIVLVDRSFAPEQSVIPTLIAVENVYGALAILMDQFNSGVTLQAGIASTAIIHSSVKLGAGVYIDDHVIIKPHVEIGDGTKIYGQVFIGDHTKIGQNVVLHPGVKIYHKCIIGDNCIIHANAVIGSDGFGFARESDGNYKKIPQTGNVVIEDNVEIGSNTVIDRASMGSTKIMKGVKLDNLIQIAHNVSIGENTAIAAQSGVAGSTQIGRNCIIGGQVGIVGHIQIADGAMIQAQSGVSASVKSPGAKLYGSPAIEYTSYLKSYAHFRRLPDIVMQLRKVQVDLEKKDQKIN
jgi:UDP-3-O-[3-hydroxymyristoyl] glucosamine N-acyltransferase